MKTEPRIIVLKTTERWTVDSVRQLFRPVHDLFIGHGLQTEEGMTSSGMGGIVERYWSETVSVGHVSYSRQNEDGHIFTVTARDPVTRDALVQQIQELYKRFGYDLAARV